MIDEFALRERVVNVLYGSKQLMHDPEGNVLVGVNGVAGAVAVLGQDVEVGTNRIILNPEAAFELHTHPGVHVLFVLSGGGVVHIDGGDHLVEQGDTVCVRVPLRTGSGSILPCAPRWNCW